MARLLTFHLSTFASSRRLLQFGGMGPVKKCFKLERRMYA